MCTWDLLTKFKPVLNVSPSSILSWWLGVWARQYELVDDDSQVPVF